MFLNATVYTPVGVFKGSVNDPSGGNFSSVELIETRNVLQKSLMDNLVIFGNNGNEITFPGDLLKNSVIEYTIDDHQIV